MALAALMIASVTACSGGTSSSSSPVSSKAPGSSSVGSSSVLADKTTVRIAALKGPTGLSLVKLMSDNEEGLAAEHYEFSLATSPDQIVAKISSGDVDIAAAPANLAAVLYNKTNGKVQMAAVTTLGVLHVLTNGEVVESIKDLKGKTIYSSGQGATPEYVLNYILKQNGLEAGKDVKVVYKAEHAELATEMISGKVKIAVLPEPFVTQVMMKNKDVKAPLDLTEEWEKAAGKDSVLTMGCLIVKKDFAQNHKEALNTFLKEFKASAEYTNSSAADAAKLSEKYEVMPQAVAAKAIPNCNIVSMDSDEMKAKIPDFLKVLYTANPKSVGGKLPGDDFYYEP